MDRNHIIIEIFDVSSINNRTNTVEGPYKSSLVWISGEESIKAFPSLHVFHLVKIRHGPIHYSLTSM